MSKFLLIGQGIAGTMLARALRNKGAEAHIADTDLPGASSRAAAGIINPVTGKRFVKSWRFDEFYPAARAAYHRLEEELQTPLWEERPILRLLGTAEETNDWSLRCARPDYLDFLSETNNAGAWAPLLQPGFHFGLIRQAARVNLPLLIGRYREKAQREGWLYTAPLPPLTDSAQLLEQYDRIVFCDGWRGQDNPFFPNLPFRVAKGEALLLRFPGIPEHELPTDMLKKTVLLAPLGDGTFWAGSTYRWHFSDTRPGDEGREFLLGYLREMLAAPFEITGHVAGIRPTTMDRRPLLEQSLLEPRMFMFNGLGTKGTLLAPLLAEEMAERLVHLP
jgi:glycine/D-amino acid oxidase-like deaminating enzyme